MTKLLGRDCYEFTGTDNLKLRVADPIQLRAVRITFEIFKTCFPAGRLIECSRLDELRKFMNIIALTGKSLNSKSLCHADLFIHSSER
jgi:hypothetical protein